MRLDGAGIQPRNVEQRVEQQLHRRGGGLDVVDQGLRFGLLIARFQRGDEQRQRVQRLPQVVAGGGEEARLGVVGALGHVLFAARSAVASRMRRSSSPRCACSASAMSFTPAASAPTSPAGGTCARTVRSSTRQSPHHLPDMPQLPGQPGGQAPGQRAGEHQRHQHQQRGMEQGVALERADLLERHADFDPPQQVTYRAVLGGVQGVVAEVGGGQANLSAQR